MSPSSIQLSGIVAGVHAYLRRRAALAAVLWVGVGAALVLLVALLAAGNDGWRQGSNLPALFDLLIVLWILAGAAWFRAGARSWFAEIPLAD